MVEFISEYEIITRLTVSFLLSGIVGLERESHNKSAGFRTHILVGMGSTLIMMLSIYGFPEAAVRDPARLAAQVVSGIGFLGAGTILKDNAGVSGLTTAATLWVVSGIGLAVGAGYYIAAIAVTALSILSLVFLMHFELRYFTKDNIKRFRLVVDESPGEIGEIGSVLGRMGVVIKKLKSGAIADELGKIEVKLTLEIPQPLDADQVMLSLADIIGVNSVEISN